jgi:hypothetical protein
MWHIMVAAYLVHCMLFMVVLRDVRERVIDCDVVECRRVHATSQCGHFMSFHPPTLKPFLDAEAEGCLWSFSYLLTLSS